MAEMFKPMKARMRATFAAGTLIEPRIEKIDKESEILYGVQITLEGEARGHGVYLDRAFCEAVAEAGNATGDAGLKCRFGHPSMCSDALGTYLGRCKNFRCVDVTRKESGERVCGVLADVYIAQESHSAPGGDLGKWVMEAAENSPDQFGQSIVFTYGDLKSTDADGAPILRSEFDSDYEFNKARCENKVFAVLGKLHGSDFTDTPAATDGVFGQDSLAAEAEDMLNAHPEILAAIEKNPEKIVEFLDRQGLLTILETKRVAGLQASKDKTIADLREIERVLNDGLTAKDALIEEMKRESEQAVSALAESREQIRALENQIEEFKSDHEASQKALDQAAADIQQFELKLGETEKALSETKAALEVESQRYRDQVGAALAQPELTLEERLAQATTPEEREAIRAEMRAIRK